MDPLDDEPQREEARRAMGDTLRLAKRIDLAACLPDTEISSAGYALVNRTPGAEEILAYLPRGRTKLSLSGIVGALRVDWFDPAKGAATEGGRIEAGGTRHLASPWKGDAVALLYSAGSGSIPSPSASRL
jgi:hypothetical protein